MPSSSSRRPIMTLLDLLGRRWQLRVLWELREGALTFRALRERCEAVSPTILNRRLAELREAGVVELREGAGYVLTADGAALLVALRPMAAWAARWGTRRGRQKGS